MHGGEEGRRGTEGGESSTDSPQTLSDTEGAFKMPLNLKPPALHPSRH